MCPGPAPGTAWELRGCPTHCAAGLPLPNPWLPLPLSLADHKGQPVCPAFWTLQASHQSLNMPGGPPMPSCSVVPLVLPRMRPASSVLWLMKSQPPSGSLSPRAGPTVCSTSCCTGTQWVHSRVCMWAPQHASWKGGSWRQPSREAPPGWGAAEDTPGRVTRHVCRLLRAWCLQAHRLDELWGPRSEAAAKRPRPGGHMPTWAWTSPRP